MNSKLWASHPKILSYKESDRIVNFDSVELKIFESCKHLAVSGYVPWMNKSRERPDVEKGDAAGEGLPGSNS
jgi:hypothetical protein